MIALTCRWGAIVLSIRENWGRRNLVVRLEPEEVSRLGGEASGQIACYCRRLFCGRACALFVPLVPHGAGRMDGTRLRRERLRGPWEAKLTFAPDPRDCAVQPLLVLPWDVARLAKFKDDSYVGAVRDEVGLTLYPVGMHPSFYQRMVVQERQREQQDDIGALLAQIEPKHLHGEMYLERRSASSD